jgi:hypothetical protein
MTNEERFFSRQNAKGVAPAICSCCHRERSVAIFSASLSFFSSAYIRYVPFAAERNPVTRRQSHDVPQSRSFKTWQKRMSTNPVSTCAFSTVPNYNCCNTLARSPRRAQASQSECRIIELHLRALCALSDLCATFSVLKSPISGFYPATS